MTSLIPNYKGENIVQEISATQSQYGMAFQKKTNATTGLSRDHPCRGKPNCAFLDNCHASQDRGGTNYQEWVHTVTVVLAMPSLREHVQRYYVIGSRHNA
ncbi:MAG: hypothetical protein QM703_15855 [Gemmatales bacterium]